MSKKFKIQTYKCCLMILKNSYKRINNNLQLKMKI